MPWVRFTADFPWHQRPAVTVMYRAGEVHLVSQACAKEAIDKERAVASLRPPKHREKDNAGR
jgi:hypothetical protein